MSWLFTIHFAGWRMGFILLVKCLSGIEVSQKFRWLESKRIQMNRPHSWLKCRSVISVKSWSILDECHTLLSSFLGSKKWDGVIVYIWCDIPHNLRNKATHRFPHFILYQNCHRSSKILFLLWVLKYIEKMPRNTNVGNCYSYMHSSLTRHPLPCQVWEEVTLFFGCLW